MASHEVVKKSVIARGAQFWGSVIGRYGRWVARPDRVTMIGLEGAPEEPTIWVSWHCNNLICLNVHRLFRSNGYAAFTPGVGLVGTTMAGWLVEAGCREVVTLPDDGTGNVSGALKRIARSIRSGRDVVIAVDGPHGPAERVRPGALWMARLTGAPLVAFGAAASPSVRMPRWDRHLVPLPGSRIVGAVGEAFRVAKGDDLDPVSVRVGDAIHAAGSTATAALAETGAATSPGR